MDAFEEKVIQLIQEFTRTQSETLARVAQAVVDHLEKGGTFYAVGTGHSHMVGEELYARAGGLACIRLIAPMELTLGEHPLKSTNIERIPEYAHVILSQYGIKKGDIVMISSNSGRNNMPVELALTLKEKQVTTIAFTNLNHSQKSTSRHASGKRLFEICDYVIDNCGVEGDALMTLEGVKGQMGASSSIIGMYMAQTLSMMIAREMVKRGMSVPVFLSANVDAGDEWNDSIMKAYYHI